MKRSELRTLIREQIINLMEDEGSQASVEAKKKGYHSAGWGRWADRSGKIVAKTVDGKLTPVNIKTDKDAYEPAKGITPDDTNMSPRDKWGGSRPAPGSSSDVTMAKLAPKSYKAGPNGRFHARNVSGDGRSFSEEFPAALFAAGVEDDGKIEHMNDLFNKSIDTLYPTAGAKGTYKLKKALSKIVSTILGGASDVIFSPSSSSSHSSSNRKSSSASSPSFGGGGGFSGGGASGKF